MPRTLLLGVCLLLGCSTGLQAQTSSTSAPAGRRVLIVSIDGLRPDLAVLGDTPTIRSLLAAGSYSLWAQTTEAAITLPSHATMVTGVSPKVHGLTWNKDNDAPADPYPKVPTLFDLSKQAGRTTSLVAGKTKMEVLARPGSVDWLWVPDGQAKLTDAVVADAAAKVITAYRPAVMMVHFPTVDAVGHAKGWGSPEQMAAIADADRALGRVLQALDEAGVRGQTLIILTADHGGSGGAHGPMRSIVRGEPAPGAAKQIVPDPASRCIPWIAVGPGVIAGQDLTRRRELDVRLEDTFATACHFLGLAMPPRVEGHPVLRIYGPPTAASQPASAPASAPAGR